MALLLNNQVIFIHVAKTGGSWVRSIIAKSNNVVEKETGDYKHNQHAGVSDLKPYYPNHKYFGFVRDPVSWLESRWSYAMQTQFDEKLLFNPEARKHWMAKYWSNNLNDFIQNYLREGVPVVSNHFSNKLNGFNIDFVGRYELLRADLFRVSEKYDLKLSREAITSYPPVNVSLSHSKMSEANAKAVYELEENIMIKFYPF